MPHVRFQAKWTAVLLLAVITAGAGCQRLPPRPIDSGDDMPVKSTVVGGLIPSKPLKTPAELPPLPAEPLPGKQGGTASPPPPTPLIDAAIARANSLEELPQAKDSDEVPTPKEAKGISRAAKSDDQPNGEPPADDTKAAPNALELAPDPMSPLELPSLSAPPSPIAVSSLKAEPSRTNPPVVLAPAPDATDLHADSGSRDDWNEGLERLRELARLRAGQPGDDAEAWSIRARLLDHLTGADDPDGANGQAWSSVLVALSTATSAETPDQAVLSVRLIEAVDALESLEPLRITEFVLCRKVLGFGAFEPIDAMTLRSGQSALIYCELSGLRYAFEDSAYHSRITSKVELVKGEGGQVVWSQTLGSADDLCRRRRRDYYVNYRIAIPNSIPPGPYRLRLTQTDLVGNQTTDSELRVALQAGVTPGPLNR